MKLSEINNSVSTLPGVGAKTAALFAKLNVFSVGDLLQFYPRDFEDRTQRISLNQFELFPKVHTIAQVCAHEWFGFGKMRTLKVLVTDKTAQAELVCFNRPFMERELPVGAICGVTGRFEVKYGRLQSTAFETVKIAESGSLEDFATATVPDSSLPCKASQVPSAPAGAEWCAPEFSALKERIAKAAEKYNAAVTYTNEQKNDEFKDLVIRHLYEMASDIIMALLLIGDASRCPELFAKSAKVYTRYAAAEIEKHYDFILSAKSEDLEDYRN